MFSGSNYQIWITEIRDGGHYTGSIHILACRQDRNAISTTKPMFSGFSNPTEQLRTLSHLTGSENPAW